MFQITAPGQTQQRTAGILPLTDAAYRRVEGELERLRAERRDHRDRLRAAREFGYSSSNDELMAAREEEAIIDARIARAEEILASAEVVDDAPDGARIAVGSVVTVLDQDSGRTASYIVDGAHGSLDANVISALSPMGLALIGHEAGDVVSVDLPRGRVRSLTVLAVAQPKARERHDSNARRL